MSVAVYNVQRMRQQQLAKKIEDGTATQGDRYEFSLFGEEVGFESLVLALAVLKIAKMEGGMKVLETLGKEFIKGIFDTLHALGQASAANKVTAWANPYIVSSILRRFGFISQFDIVQFRVGLSIIAGAVVAEGFLDTIQGMFPFTKPEPSEFPQQIVFSAREAGIEVPKEISWTEVAELMRARKLYRAPRKKKGK